MLSLGRLVVSLVSATSAALPSKSPLTLTGAVDGSTFICIGTVDRVETVQLPDGWGRDIFEHAGDLDMSRSSDTPFGRIVVERVLKGDPATKFVLHEAWSTWTCDTTSACVGERSLFFLRPGRTSDGDVSPDVLLKLVDAFGNTPILRNVGSGDGIFPITTPENGEPFVTIHGAPKEYRIRGNREPGRGRERLTQILEHVEVLARFAPERIAVHATSRPSTSPRALGFDLRILPDGSLRLAAERDAAPRFEKLTDASWQTLQAALDSALPDVGAISFGHPESSGPSRKLRVALPGVRFSLEDDGGAVVPAVDDAQYARYCSAIEAWRLVRGVMDCPECVDHVARDVELLKR